MIVVDSSVWIPFFNGNATPLTLKLNELLSTELAVIGARHDRLLRNQGVTVRKTIDRIIGTFCIFHGHQLLHADRDFDPMQKYLGLDVLETAWAVHEP